MAVKIKHVKGNVLRLHIPLTVKIKRLVDGEITEEEQDFIPSPYYPTFINLKKDVGLTQSFTATVDGNVVSMEDKGTLSVGEYQVEVKCNDDLGYPYRYMVKAVVEIVDATIDAGIEAGIEFDSEDYTLDGAVFISYGGGVFEQIQSDWEETLEDARSFIRNKPDLSVYQEKEEGKVLSSNDYTDGEKAKLANLNNYDDTNLRDLISQKVDKVSGKGLSTNDYTSLEKTKLANLNNYNDSRLRAMINTKVDKISGKGLSTNDYTTQEKVKLSQLSNYDDSQIRSMINNLANSLANNYYTKSLTYNKNEVNSLIEAVQSFSLVYVGELPTPSANTLRKMYLVPSSSSSRQNIKDEYITIQSSGQYRWELIGSTDIDLSNYVTIAQFNTALASLSVVARTGNYNDLNDKPTFKTINNQSILGTGNIDIEGGDGVQSDWNETDTDDPAYIKNKPTIPSEVTESTVAGWGFTKNTGTYSKPSDGIPSTDMSSDVQTSLGKADTALQSETDPVFGASAASGITSSDISNWNGKQGAISDLDAIRSGAALGATALQSFTETDPTVPSWAKASSKPSYTASEVGAVPTTRTVNGKALSSDVTLDASDVGALPSSTPIPVVPTNVSAFTNDAGYLTSHQDISGKEDKVTIESASGATLSAQVGKYYTLSNVVTLAITLPTIPSGTTKVQTVTFYIAAGSSPAVTFTSTHPVYYADGFEIADDSTYEVNALWNGVAWVVASVTIITS